MSDQGETESTTPTVRNPGRWKLQLVLAGVMWLAKTVQAAARSPYVVKMTPWTFMGSGLFVAFFFIFPAFTAGARYTEWARIGGRRNIFGPRSRR